VDLNVTDCYEGLGEKCGFICNPVFAFVVKIRVQAPPEVSSAWLLWTWFQRSFYQARAYGKNIMLDEKLISALLAKKLLDKYPIQQITKETFFSLFKEGFFRYFQDMIYFDYDALFNNYIHREQLSSYEFQAKALCLVFYDEDLPIALFKGRPINASTFSMDFSGVHVEYRRKGIYTALLETILNYTKLSGFSIVNSSHSPNNNGILISKMKKGFKLTAMTISPEFGPIVTLTYFHNPSYEKAFLFRCGKVEMDQELVENSRGTLHTFNSLINKCIDEPYLGL
jgi:GNAT superfamily N-acetyltransferase